MGDWEGGVWGIGEERGPTNGFDQNAAFEKSVMQPDPPGLNDP